MTWIPGFQRVQGTKNGGSYVNDPSVPFRLVVHTTETDGGAYTMAKNHLYSPHFWVDPETKEKYQTIDTDKSAYALLRVRGGIETNGMKAIQIEIVGRAAETQNWPIEWYDWLALEVFKPICEDKGIDWNNYHETYGANQGIVLATKSSPIRLSDGEWKKFNGITFHQKIPTNDHWDAGDFNIQRVVAVLNGSTPRITPNNPPPAPKPLQMVVLKNGMSGGAVTILQGDLYGLGNGLGKGGGFAPQNQKTV